jgi:hypothetical protein
VLHDGQDLPGLLLQRAVSCSNTTSSTSSRTGGSSSRASRRRSRRLRNFADDLLVFAVMLALVLFWLVIAARAGR